MTHRTFNFEYNTFVGKMLTIKISAVVKCHKIYEQVNKTVCTIIAMQIDNLVGLQ